MKMEKRKFRIGELADHLGVERFVVRFWEKEFDVKAKRSDGGQRFYDEKDLKKFSIIKELLYNQGFTIAGAKKFLKTNPQKAPEKASETIIASKVTSMEPDIKAPESLKKDIQPSPLLPLTEQIIELQKKLVQLRNLL